MRTTGSCKTDETPNLSDVIKSSQGTIEQLNTILAKVDHLADSLNSTKGSIGELINNPDLYNKAVRYLEPVVATSGRRGQWQRLDRQAGRRRHPVQPYQRHGGQAGQDGHRSGRGEGYDRQAAERRDAGQQPQPVRGQRKPAPCRYQCRQRRPGHDRQGSPVRCQTARHSRQA